MVDLFILTLCYGTDWNIFYRYLTKHTHTHTLSLRLMASGEADWLLLLVMLFYHISYRYALLSLVVGTCSLICDRIWDVCLGLIDTYSLCARCVMHPENSRSVSWGCELTDWYCHGILHHSVIEGTYVWHHHTWRLCSNTYWVAKKQLSGPYNAEM